MKKVIFPILMGICFNLSAYYASTPPQVNFRVSNGSANRQVEVTVTSIDVKPETIWLKELLLPQQTKSVKIKTERGLAYRISGYFAEENISRSFLMLYTYTNPIFITNSEGDGIYWYIENIGNGTSVPIPNNSRNDIQLQVDKVGRLSSKMTGSNIKIVNFVISEINLEKEQSL